MPEIIDRGVERAISIQPVCHRGEARLALHFPYDKAMIGAVKALPGARWSDTMKCWHVPDTAESRIAMRASGLPLDPVTLTTTNPVFAGQPSNENKAPLHSGTTVGVPTKGDLSGISSYEESSVLPQAD
ncbi:MAG: hypothetical protein J5I41_02120, partial [Saprospiraceae bacterium]|nr:hypothetical protein [Saprospiraceae bacterium]